MYLKAIELVGFKSFAERVRLDFAEGLTTIVGANGSGKSNIVDAVLWVMGEQNARNLRGAKMEEIIFSGSEKRRAVGMAEVTLIIDNQSHLLPLDYEEVSVMRRLFRDGTSEYYINQQQCRLKDIVEMFLDTGVGRDSFSIIGQGQIDEILSYKPAERRVILEEVAGIAKFKFRKKEAMQKLDRLQERLQRVDDIVSELDAQINPLMQQAQQAELYLKLRDELKKYEITYLSREYRRMSTERVDLQLQNNQAMDAYSASQARTAAEMAILEKMKLEQIQLEHKIDSMNQQSNQLRINMEQFYGEEKIIDERILHDRSLLAQVSEEERSEEKRQAEIVEQIQKLTLEQEKNEIEILTLQREIEKKQGIFDELLTQETNRKQEEGELQEQSNRTLQTLHSIKGRLEGLVREQDTIQSRLDQLTHARNESITVCESKKSQMLDLQARLEKNAKETQENEIVLKDKESDYDELQKELLKLQDRVQQLQTGLRINTGRLTMITELSDQMEGYHKGVKAVMSAKKRNPREFQGIHDTVAGLFHVEKEHETAIEMIMGNSLQNIVVDQPKDAETAIEWLKKEKAGRASFYPLTTVRGNRDHNLWQRIQGKAGVIAIASDLVRTDEPYRSLVESVLGNVVVAETLPLANKIAQDLNHRYRIVTLEGDVIFPGGSITGGSLYQKGVSLLGREREIQELETLVAEQKKQISLYETELHSQTQQSEQKNRELSDIKRNRNDLEQQHRQLQLTQRLLQAEIESKSGNLLRQELELQDLQNKQELLSGQIDEHRNQLLQVQTEETILRQRLQACRDADQSDLRYEAQNQLQQFEVSFAIVQQKKAEMIQQKGQLEERILQVAEDSKAKKIRFVEITERIQENIEELAQIQEKYRLTAAQQEQADLNFQAVKEQRGRFRESLAEQDEQIFQARKAEDRLREQAYHKSSILTKLDSELQYLLDKVQNDYNLEAKDLPEEPLVEVENSGELQKTCTRLRNKIRDMGLVNLGAIDEKKRLEERKSYLTEQGEDIRVSCQGIWKVLAEIDKDMEHRFEEAFQQVNHHFQQVFTQLFQGGLAHLQLTDPGDLLNTGLDIMAQLPGKKAGNLSLLSGGERALTAVALLIAILQVKKPPFCLLDEVETSLDEGNVKRVAKILRSCSGDTQIISVSHRKGMMEESDALIGVTMQSPGVSTVISVRFGEKEKQE